MRYTPYGVSRDADAGYTDHLFTSQVQDGSVGLYWYGSRAYDAGLGRFVVADTVVPSATNPQALNRYSYTINNPLKYVDAQGRFPVSQVGPLPPVPVGDLLIPEGFDFDKDIAEAQQHQRDLPWFINQVKPHGPWDFKWQWREYGGSVWEPFGNFHFGIVGSAAGFSEEFLTRGAGAVQFWTKLTTDPLGQKGYPSEGVPLLVPPFGDDHRDYNRIKLGIDWYKQHESARSANQGTTMGILGWSSEPRVEFVQARPSDWSQIPGNVELAIPGQYAPGGVAVVGITRTNPSGGPASGGSWDSPGGANAAADAEARRAAWEAAGSPDYNALRAAGARGY